MASQQEDHAAHPPGASDAFAKRAQRRYSLSCMLTALVLVTALPLIAMWIYSALRTARAEIERGNQQVVEMAEVAALDTAAALDELRRLLTFMAGREQVRAIDPVRCDPLLADLLKLRRDLVNAATVDAAGNGICSVLRRPAGSLPNVGGADWLAEVKRRNDFVISTPQRGIFSGRWVVVLAHPLRDGAGAVSGAVELVVALEAFQPVTRVTLPAGGVVAIANAAGVVIARAPEPEKYVGRDMRESPVMRLVLEKRAGTETGTGIAVGVTGLERYYAFKPIGATGWYAVAGLPTETIYAQARRNTWLAAGLGAATLLLSVLLMLVLKRRIAAPIQALTATARQVAEGRFDERVAVVGGPSEVAEVAVAMNQMLDRIPLIERALRDSEKHYRTLVEAAPEAILVHRDGRILMANPAAAHLYGFVTATDMVGREGTSLVHPDSAVAARARAEAALGTGQTMEPFEQRHLRADGMVLDVETVAIRVDYEGAPAVVVMVRDISARKAAERRVSRLTNLYAALSWTNEVIFRESDLLVICRSVCEIAVRNGGMAAALVRRPNPETGRLEAVCHSGASVDWVRDLKIAPDQPFNNGARVFREGGFHVVRDYATDDNIRETREELLRSGYRSAAIFAIGAPGASVGLFSVFATEPDYFDAELVALLQELARNLSFAFARDSHRAALADSESRYRMLFDAAPDAIRVICEDRVVLANPAAVRMFGYSEPAEMIGRFAFDNIDPGGQALARERLRATIEERRALAPREHRITRADGSKLLVESLLIPVEFGGKPAALAILRDLTERVAAEYREKRLTRLYVALSRTNEAIFRHTRPEELYEAVSDIAVSHGGLRSAVVRVLDRDAGMLLPHAYRGPDVDWIGRRAVAVNDPDSRVAQVVREGGRFVSNDMLGDPAVANRYEDAVRAGVRATATFALRVGDEIVGTLSVGAAEVNFFDAGLQGLIGEMAENLSFALKRHRESLELARLEGHYRALFDASPDAIRVICDERVVMLNPAGVRMFGLNSAEDMVGKLVYDTVTPEFRSMSMERLRTVIEERREAPPTEQALMRADGSLVPVQVTTLPFEFEGRPAALSILHDLTARKEVEQATQRLNAELEVRVQRRTSELRRVNADLESFSYSVAHDLRAPLRAMTGFAQLLALDAEAGNAAEVAAHVGRITHNAERMNHLIDGLLNVSNTAHRALAIESVDMRTAVEEVVAELAARERAQVEIGPMPHIAGDRAALRQVWTNLLSNALKYSAKQTRPAIDIGCESVDGTAVFHVTDNGVGFDAAYAEKLFGVFSRLHSASDYEGIGIGLAIVKRVVERHGGRVWAESSPNAGATFYFSLPLGASSRPAE